MEGFTYPNDRKYSVSSEFLAVSKPPTLKNLREKRWQLLSRRVPQKNSSKSNVVRNAG